VDSRSGKTHFSFFNLILKSSKILAILYDIFYQDNKKVVRWDCIYTLLTARAIAFWIIDDGQHVKRAGVTLCTDNYTFAEVINLILILEIKFGLVCTINTKNHSNRKNTYYRIYIHKSSIFLLRSLVSEYMHPSMIYKLN